MNKRLFIILLIALIPAIVHSAQPSLSGVSGTISHDENITITGTGFGTHADYHANVTGKLAWLWQDFETGLEYDGLSYNPGGSSSGYWVRQTSNGRNGYWAYRTGIGNVQYYQTSHDAIDTGTFFMSYWSYVPSSADNGKAVRLAFSGWGDVDYWINLNNGAVASDVPTQFVDYGLDVPKGSWHRMDMLLTGASGATSQKFHVVGSNSNNPIYSATRAGIQVRDTVQLMLGAGYTASNQGWGYDDIYANFTQARVEICNSSTWAARSQCEIQQVSAWSATSITTPVNRGGFATDATAYLYVVDSAGDVNANGYEVTFGDEGGTPSISAPSGLRVVGGWSWK